MGHGCAEPNTGGGRWDLVRASHGKLVLVAMVGVLSMTMCSYATAVVAV